jgi:hypothetical protein
LVVQGFGGGGTVGGIRSQGSHGGCNTRCFSGLFVARVWDVWLVVLDHRCIPTVPGVGEVIVCKTRGLVGRTFSELRSPCQARLGSASTRILTSPTYSLPLRVLTSSCSHGKPYPLPNASQL